ncbi:hypothetical protein AOQ88_00190 [Candidatus Riesia sp. GBBU]|nr:hypothetical protein AOQ88_00190 [Candidatus Riesia sp. GBBU]
MKETYNPKEIEKTVQDYWEKTKKFQVSEEQKQKKYYCLSMIPYPSGKLHIGHIRNYTIGDVISRYKRMLGKNVLYPIGWDAFGLPAENAAIDNNKSPDYWTNSNINSMRKQLKQFGFSYDWSREIVTCDSNYYKWEQWFFIKLYKKGLIYKSLAEVNWCPKDLTVLANEQVSNNRCWRCDTKIKRKKMKQWFLKITEYADELLQGLKKLNKWPKEVIDMQKNWIGKKKRFQIKLNIYNSKKKILVYIDKFETLIGSTYISVHYSHKIVNTLSKKDETLKNLIKDIKVKSKNLANKKFIKIGINIKKFAIHPITKNKIQIWIVNFIKDGEAIFSVPAHNNEDWKFAKKYNLPIKFVVLGDKNQSIKKPMMKNGILINSGEFDGIESKIASKIIKKKLKYLGILKEKVTFRMKDWNISRQRYWGVPIPIIVLQDGSTIPVQEKSLPIILPKTPIVKKNKLVINWSKLEVNGNIAHRETDTFDTFIESSWYYARYTCPNYKKSMIDKTSANYWLPIDLYIGGIEHATMHLLYFRFFHKLMRDEGLVKTDEPAKELLCQGMVLSDTFYFLNKKNHKVWVSPDNVLIKKDRKGNILEAKDNDGNVLIYAGKVKMSKSKNNGIYPEKIVRKYGADSVRLAIIFAAPPKLNFEWKEKNITGSYRFICKIWKIVFKHQKSKEKKISKKIVFNKYQSNIRYNLYKMLEDVTNDINKYYFNTAIAKIMKFVNQIKNISYKKESDFSLMQESIEILILILYPIIPHVCFEMWKYLNKNKNIEEFKWPKLKKITKTSGNLFTLIVQIDGKLRNKFVFKEKTPKSSILKKVIKNKKISKYISKKEIKDIIFIPKKLINLVTK